MSEPLDAVTARSSIAAEVLHDLEILQRPAKLDMDRAELVVELAMLRVQLVISPIPEGARPVLLQVATRAYNNRDGVKQETAGPFSRTFADAGVYLTEGERTDLESMNKARSRGAFTIRPGAGP